MQSHILSDIQFPRPTCQCSLLRTHTHAHAHAQRLTYKHMWAWLESCGWLTNGMVFIFCLWRGGGNDSIIVLSAQHSLPISIEKSSAAGYLCLWKLQRHTLYSLTHSQKQDSIATVVNRSHEEECCSLNVFVHLLFCSGVCNVILFVITPRKMLLKMRLFYIHWTRQSFQSCLDTVRIAGRKGLMKCT